MGSDGVDAEMVEVREEWLPLFIESLVGWQSFPAGARQMAESVIGRAMSARGAKAGGYRSAVPNPVAIRRIVTDFLKRRPHPVLRTHLAALWAVRNATWTSPIEGWASQKGLQVCIPFSFERDEETPDALSSKDLDDAEANAPLPGEVPAELRRLFLSLVLFRPLKNSASDDATRKEEAQTVSLPSPAVVAQGDAATESQHASAALTPTLERWLAEAKKWPHGAPEWDAIPAFAQAVKALREASRDEAANEARRQLARRLTGLFSEETTLLLQDTQLFHHLQRPRWTSSADISYEKLESAASYLMRLERLMVALKDVVVRPGLSRDEARRRRQEIDRLDDELTRELDALESLLGKPPATSSAAGEDLSGTAPSPDLNVPVENTKLPDVVTPKSEEAATAPNGKPTDAQRAHQPTAPTQPLASPLGGKPPEPAPPITAEALLAAVAPASATLAAQAAPPPVELPRAESAQSVALGKPTARVSNPFPTIDLQAAARAVLAAPEDAHGRSNFIVALVAAKDASAAAWVTRAMEKAAQTPPFSSAVVRAYAGALLLPAEGGETLHAGLLEVVSSSHDVPATNAANRLLALAAAVRVAPVAPMAGMRAWLFEDAFPGARNVLEALRAFADKNVALPTDVGSAFENSERRLARIAELAKNAQGWLQHAPKFTSQYRQASRVWSELVAGKIKRLLEVPNRDERKRVVELEELMSEFATDDERKARIEETRVALRCPNAIIGPALRKLLRDTEDAYQLAAQWRDAVRTEEQLGTRLDRAVSLVESLRSTLERELSGVERQLSESRERATSVEEAAALGALSTSFEWLGWRLSIGGRGTTWRDQSPRSDAFIDSTRSLQSLLAQRLKVFPSVQLADSASWDDSLPALVSAIASDTVDPEPIPAVIEKWVDARDFRFVSELSRAIPDAAERERLDAFAKERYEFARGQLKKVLEHLERHAEQAYVDGAIGAERAHYLGESKRIRAAFEEAENLEPAFRQVAELESGLARLRSDGLAHQRQKWSGIEKELQARPYDLPLIKARVETGFAKGDVRGVDEFLSHLEMVLEGGRTFAASMFEPPSSGGYFESFLEKLVVYERDIGRARGREAAQKLEASNGATPNRAKQDFRKLFEAWGRLEDAKTHQERAGAPLAEVLRFVGFDVRTPPVFAGAIRTGSRFKVDLSSRGRSPLPDYGSRLETQPVEAICVWARPGAPVLQDVFSEFKDDVPRVVLFVGRLSRAERQRLRVDAKKHRSTAIVLDEWLLFFLESLPEAERLEGCLAAALPWSYLNPFVTKSIGVPPEMFFGREEMISALGEVHGSYIVYGGRQLGKSALLEQVERRNSDPTKSRFAVRLDIKPIGDPAAIDRDTRRLFTQVRDLLQHKGLLKARVTSDEPTAIMRAIISEVNSRSAHLLILLDEADNFLDADSHHGFVSVMALRNAMTESQGRLKVVLAGLHNVQRFQSIPNQPFAQLGAAQLVGPLDPDAAIKLIRRPFEAMGYRFKANSSALLHILSFTNYHPGLIQLFCQHLLQQIRQQGDGIQLPYEITEELVEEVYRKREVQDEIRERFRWTLALDPRYRALAFASILAQDDGDPAHVDSLSVAQFLDEGRYWWRTAFESLRSDDVRGLLEEMVGLGVLSHAGPDRYRLRSPNVVRLLGGRSDIERNLQELESLPPPAHFLPDHQHERLSASAATDFKFSPLSIAQERQCLGGRSSSLMVYGSAATGLDDLWPALNDLMARLQGSAGRPEVHAAPAGLNDPKEFAAYLRRLDKDTPKATSRILVHRRLESHEAAVGDLVAETEAYLAKRKADARLIRVLFSVPPSVAWKWLVGANSQFSRADVPWTSLRRWSKEGVRRLLSDVEIANEDRSVEHITAVSTGGWSVFLRALLSRHERGGAMAASQAFVAHVSAHSEVLGQLWSALELTGIEAPVAIIRALADGNCGFEQPDQVLGLMDSSDASSVREVLVPAVSLLERLDVLEPKGKELQLAPLVARSLPLLR